MTASEMVESVKDRSKQPDASKILRELRAAYRWAMNRVYNTEGGPDLLSTIGQELTVSGTTRDYNLAANVTNFLGLKQLWLKLSGDVVFTPMQEADLEAPSFQDRDAQPTATPDIAFGHPVLYHVNNFGMIRFAPALPDGAVLRADFFKFGTAPDPTTNDAHTEAGTLFHDAIVCKASAHCLENRDDDRTGAWETRARDYLNDALFAAQRRVQGPVAHQGWARRRRRMFV